MKKKNILTAAVSAALVAVLAVGATLAYLTDNSGTVSNKFQMDGLTITLKENASVPAGEFYKIQENSITAAKPNTNPINGTDKGVIYTEILPGATVAKNPYVTVSADNAHAYVYTYVEGVTTNSDDLLYTTWSKGWEPVAAAELNGTLLRREVAKDAAGTYDVFTQVHVNFDADGTEALNEISIGAFAHQADHVDSDTADAAAIAYFAKQ